MSSYSSFISQARKFGGVPITCDGCKSTLIFPTVSRSFTRYRDTIEKRISGILRRHLQRSAARVARYRATLARAGQASQQGKGSAAGRPWGADLGKGSLQSWRNVLPPRQCKHNCDDDLSAESAGARPTWGIFHEDSRPVALPWAIAQARPEPSLGAVAPSGGYWGTEARAVWSAASGGPGHSS